MALFAVQMQFQLTYVGNEHFVKIWLRVGSACPYINGITSYFLHQLLGFLDGLPTNCTSSPVQYVFMHNLNGTKYRTLCVCSKYTGQWCKQCTHGTDFPSAISSLLETEKLMTQLTLSKRWFGIASSQVLQLCLMAMRSEGKQKACFSSRSRRKSC